MQSKKSLDSGLEIALARLKAKGDFGHVHSKRCIREICTVLTEGEETIMEIKQSHIRNITPERIVATNKRLIIVRPSFFGHYLGFDLFNHTDISFVPYKQLISIVMSRGKFLSTIHMRIHGFTDFSSAIRNEGEVEGVRSNLATKFTMFIEDIIENRGDEQTQSLYEHADIDAADDDKRIVSIDDAKAILKLNNKTFVWLGFEPVGEIAAKLGVGEQSISRLDMSALTEAQVGELQNYGGSVLVCYDGITSRRIAKHLKEEHGVDVYVLKKGLMHSTNQTIEKVA